MTVYGETEIDSKGIWLIVLNATYAELMKKLPFTFYRDALLQELFGAL